MTHCIRRPLVVAHSQYCFMPLSLQNSCQPDTLLAEALVSKVMGKKVVRRSKSRKTVTSSPASLPPQVPDVDAGASIIPPDAEIVPAVVKKPFWDVSKDSKCYGTT